MIYASPYGGRRHHAMPHCNGLNSADAAMLRDVPPITRTEAVRRGLEPCRLCKPPPLLTVITIDDEGDEP